MDFWNLGIRVVIGQALGVESRLWRILGSVISSGFWVLSWMMVVLSRGRYWCRVKDLGRCGILV